MNTWILIADGKLARVLETTGADKKLTDVFEDTFRGEKGPGREIMADRPGRTFDRHGQGRHAMEPRSKPGEIAERKFIAQMVDLLDDAARKGLYDKLILVAPPKALGELRAALPKRLQQMVTAELNKDLVHLPIHDLAGHLEQHL